MENGAGTDQLTSQERPAGLDLHCFLNRIIILGFSSVRVNLASFHKKEAGWNYRTA